MKGCNKYLNDVKQSENKKSLEITHAQKKYQKIMTISPRAEKIAIKDAKLRTFITSDKSRDDLVEHVYDVTYGKVKTQIILS